jgi:hypothetical protein
MNLTLEQKIKDLMIEADNQGAGAVYAVLHMLLGSYNTRTHNKFAQHCCQFSPISLQVSPKVSEHEDEFAKELKSETYVN